MHKTSRAPVSPSSIDPLLPVVGERTAPIYANVARFAESGATILVRGPTGIGKTRLAAWIHQRSRRRARPFVDADLHSLPPGLAASALFGHRRGAFTGAEEHRKGRLAEADGGTLFLDEIDKLGMAEQALLLRVLESGDYREIGGESRQADVRFVVGTNANLERLVKTGRFREDLYFRINAIPVHLPPLCERRDEIIPWSEHMLREIHARESTEPGSTARLEPDAHGLLLAQRWPGGLRQLRAILERAWLLARLDERDGEVCVSGPQVSTALVLDRPQELARLPALERDLVRHLDRAAQLGAELVVARAQSGAGAIPLAIWEGFSGMVLEAVGRTRTLDRASTSLFGLESQVLGSNYKRTYQRAMTRGMQLLDAVVGRGGEESALEVEP